MPSGAGEGAEREGGSMAFEGESTVLPVDGRGCGKGFVVDLSLKTGILIGYSAEISIKAST